MKKNNRIPVSENCYVYAAVYETAGKVWVSTSTISLHKDEVVKTVRDTEKKIPLWAAENRFLRVAMFKLSELLG